MKLIYTITTALAILIVSVINGQTSPLKMGTYGSYADISTYTELTLNGDSSFKYYDQFELGSNFRYTGKWKVKRNKLILCCSENNTMRPMPTQWKIDNDKLVSNKVRGLGRRKYKRTLIYAAE